MGWDAAAIRVFRRELRRAPVTTASLVQERGYSAVDNGVYAGRGATHL